MVTLLLLVTLSLEEKLLLGEEEASAKLFPDDKVVDLVPETCAATGTTPAVRVTLTADTHAISLPLFCPVYFLAHKPGDGNGNGKAKCRAKKWMSFFRVCSAAKRRERSTNGRGGGGGGGAKRERRRAATVRAEKGGRRENWSRSCVFIFIFLAKFPQKAKLNFKISKIVSDIGGFQSPEVREKKSKKTPDFYIWFSVCSQKYRRIINKFYCIFSL
jgi:hypothetical protein